MGLAAVMCMHDPHMHDKFKEFQFRYCVQSHIALSFNNVGWQDYKKKLSGGGAPKEKKAKAGKNKS